MLEAISIGLRISRKVIGREASFPRFNRQKFPHNLSLQRSKMLYEFLGDFFNEYYLLKSASDTRDPRITRLQFEDTVKTFTE